VANCRHQPNTGSVTLTLVFRGRFVRGFVTKTLDGLFDVHVMEYVEGGDLLTYVTSSKDGCIDEGRLRPILWDMATAVRDAKRLGAVMIMVRTCVWC
jgi:serine/threonine protein kinase